MPMLVFIAVGLLLVAIVALIVLPLPRRIAGWLGWMTIAASLIMLGGALFLAVLHVIQVGDVMPLAGPFEHEGRPDRRSHLAAAASRNPSSYVGFKRTRTHIFS